MEKDDKLREEHDQWEDANDRLTGRALRNPMADSSIEKAMNTDLTVLGMSRSEFADRLKSKLQTIGWWFSNSAVPMSKIIDVVNLFGPESHTFAAFKRVTNKVLAGDVPTRTRKRVLEVARQLDGLEELNKFVHLESDKYETINKMMNAFIEKYPVYADVARSRVYINTGGISNLPVPNTPDTLLRVKQAAGLGQTNYRTTSFQTYSQTEMDAVIKEVDRLIGDGSALPFMHNNNRQYIRVASAEMIVAVCALPFVRIKTDIIPVITAVKAAAFEIQQAMLADKRKGVKRDALLFIWDHHSILHRRSYHESNRSPEDQKKYGTPTNDLIKDIKELGIKFAYADNISEMAEAIGYAIDPEGWTAAEEQSYEQQRIDTYEDFMDFGFVPEDK